ncbi:hypothetical protein TRFO_42002 [Tritrichomonas foetus]|uniref:Uncharacterized protein n=1 Tax=Tritrichomonas foetus TaxID=1144522 RepID=A0A1J4L2J2_9EUKA|nr:hypothetical protein TRFO_42002 [Tritrichomonas foetus]|eukprot:OHT16166.1 hypothetical protein TRFO_42002 [Tritrichomonas foetus]
MNANISLLRHRRVGFKRPVINIGVSDDDFEESTHVSCNIVVSDAEGSDDCLSSHNGNEMKLSIDIKINPSAPFNPNNYFLDSNGFYQYSYPCLFPKNFNKSTNCVDFNGSGFSESPTISHDDNSHSNFSILQRRVNLSEMKIPDIDKDLATIPDSDLNFEWMTDDKPMKDEEFMDEELFNDLLDDDVLYSY